MSVGLKLAARRGVAEVAFADGVGKSIEVAHQGCQGLVKVAAFAIGVGFGFGLKVGVAKLSQAVTRRLPPAVCGPKRSIRGRASTCSVNRASWKPTERGFVSSTRSRSSTGAAWSVVMYRRRYVMEESAISRTASSSGASRSTPARASHAKGPTWPETVPHACPCRESATHNPASSIPSRVRRTRQT